MQDMFRTFVGLSVFAGAVLYICPEGGARRILRLLSAAILTATVLSTMGTFDYDLLNLEEARFAAAAAELSNRSFETGDSLKKMLLQENLEDYIVSRGQELGLLVQSTVIEFSRNEEGQWLPYAAEIEAAGPAEAAEELADLLNREIGIPKDRQVWTLYG